MAVVLSRKPGGSGGGGGPPSGPAGGALAGTYPNPTLAVSPAVVLIQDVLLGAAAATFDFTSISGTYKHLRIVMNARGDTAAANIFANLTFNADTGANYDRQFLDGSGTTAAASVSAGQTSMIVATLPAASATSGYAGTCELLIPDYAGTAFQKNLHGTNGKRESTTTSTWLARTVYGAWRSTAAITRITLTASAGNFLTGSRCSLYGLN